MAYDGSEFLLDEGLATVNLPPGVTLKQYLESEQFNPAATSEPVD
jgi:hypothetical protein